MNHELGRWDILIGILSGAAGGLTAFAIVFIILLAIGWALDSMNERNRKR
jgi:hypothetical protein